VRVTLLRVTSTNRGRHRHVMVMRMVVVMVRSDTRQVFATGGRGHGRCGRGRRANSRCGGQELLVTTDRLVVTRWARGQRWQRWRGRAPLDAGRRRRRHYRRGTTSSARGRFGERLLSVEVVVVAAAAVVVVPWTVAVSAHLSEKKTMRNSNQYIVINIL